MAFDSLTDADRARLDALFESNLHYVGKAKLDKMPDAELGYVLVKYANAAGDAVDAPDADTSKDVTVHRVLMYKERTSKTIKAKLDKDAEEARAQRTKEFEDRVAASSPRNSPTTEVPVRPNTPSPPPPPNVSSKLDVVEDSSTTTKPVATSPEVFVKQPTVKIVAFNVLKLQMSKAAVADQWLAIVATFATFDIVVMQEIPHKDETMKKQIELFSQILKMHSSEDTTWDYRVSKPSGPGSYKERHAVFVKSPAKIVLDSQWVVSNGPDDVDVHFDYQPLTVLIESPVFEEVLGESRIVLSSVHLPPSSKERRDARDRQLNAMLHGYPLSAEARLNTAFTRKGASDARSKKHSRAIHMLMGDFNVAPQLKDDDGKEVYGLEKNGWAPPLIGKDMSTSSGQQCYDNMIVDSESFEALSERCFVHAEVMELAVFQKKGCPGASDHSPIAVAFKKAPQTKQAAKQTERKKKQEQKEEEKKEKVQ